MLVRARFFQNAAFHGLFFEAPQRRINAFTRLDNHLCQMFSILSCIALRIGQAAPLKRREISFLSIPQFLAKFLFVESKLRDFFLQTSGAETKARFLFANLQEA